MTGVRIPKLINTLYYYYHHCKVKKNYVPNWKNGYIKHYLKFMVLI